MNPNSISNHDLRLLYRSLDGALPPAEDHLLQQRLVREPALSVALERLRVERQGFAAAAGQRLSGPSAGFAAKVLAAVRQLPARDALQAERMAGVLVQTCRRLLVAAAVLLALGLAWQVGVFGPRGPQTLEAAPADLQRTMDRLDAMIREGALQPGPTGSSGQAGELRRK
jgi:hypothetical protein